MPYFTENIPSYIHYLFIGSEDLRVYRTTSDSNNLTSPYNWLLIIIVIIITLIVITLHHLKQSCKQRSLISLTNISMFSRFLPTRQKLRISFYFAELQLSMEIFICFITCFLLISLFACILLMKLLLLPCFVSMFIFFLFYVFMSRNFSLSSYICDKLISCIREIFLLFTF